MPFENILTEQLMNNSIFAVLCVGLLIYTLKANREDKTQMYSILKEQGDKLSEITQVLSSLVVRLDKVEYKLEERTRNR